MAFKHHTVEGRSLHDIIYLNYGIYGTITILGSYRKCCPSTVVMMMVMIVNLVITYLYPQRTHMLRPLGPKTPLCKAFGLCSCKGLA